MVANELHAHGVYAMDNGLGRDDPAMFIDDDDDLTAILRLIGNDWALARPLNLWTAERRRGTEVHYIVAHDAAELVRKIMRAGE